MVHILKQLIRKYSLFIGLFACSTTVIQACLTTIANDSPLSIMIIDHNDPANKSNLSAPATIITILKNSSRRIGKPHELSHFSVYTTQPKSKTFSHSYTIRQTQCSKTGNPIIRVSDLVNGKVDSTIFTVTTIEQFSSTAAHQLSALHNMEKPDLFKKEETMTNTCSLCSH